MTLNWAFALLAMVAALGLWMALEAGNPAKPEEGFWHVLKYGRAKPAPKSRRQELLEARAHLLRQMEILHTHIGNFQTPPPDNAGVEDELRQVLDGIERELQALPSNRVG